MTAPEPGPAGMHSILGRTIRDRRTRRFLRAVLAAGGPRLELQPIIDLRDGTVAGFEALARFDDADGRGTEQWFADAERLGMGATLEAAAIRALQPLVRGAGRRVSVNVSGPALLSPEVRRALEALPPELVEIELTEHALAPPDALAAALVRLRGRGFRLALDDLGSAYAGLERVLRLRPDVLKLDRCLITGLDRDPGKQALVRATVGLARDLRASVVAEGVETAEEAIVLRELGVHLAQGFYLGHPSPPPITASHAALAAAG